MRDKDAQRRNEILRLVGDCLTNKEIAEQLHLSRSSVAYYMNEFYQQHGWYGAGARYRLIRFALTGKDGDQ